MFLKKTWKENSKLYLVLSILALLAAICFIVEPLGRILVMANSSVFIDNIKDEFFTSNAFYLIEPFAISFFSLFLSVIAMFGSMINVIGFKYKKIEWNEFGFKIIMFTSIFAIIYFAFRIYEWNDYDFVIYLVLILAYMGSYIYAFIEQKKKLFLKKTGK